MGIFTIIKKTKAIQKTRSINKRINNDPFIQWNTTQQQRELITAIHNMDECHKHNDE